MQFLVIGRDGKDEKALERRMKARPAHFKIGDELLASRNMWYGCAILDDDGKMIGSMLLMDFPSRKQLDEWLKAEPYVTEKVWEKIEIHGSNTTEPWQFNRPKEFFDRR